MVADKNGRIYDGTDILFVLAKYFHAKHLLKGADRYFKFY